MNPIKSILIANRGEIASRIIRTCKRMGIKSVAIYSDADAGLPYVSEADTAVHIGESDPGRSYLDMDEIINTALRLKVDAIHPGYGFLSENPVFAERCRKEALIFIGPNSKTIKAMGSKAEAKVLMQKNGVPTIPGYSGSDQSINTLTKESEKIGFPVLLKASAGGGGKGMRIVHKKEELKKAIDAAKREAMSAFGVDELIIEKYISLGRHIEFQIFGDQHGNVIHILERECTIQRRYQKIIEESPSPVLTEEIRANMGTSAVKVAKTLKYDNAGTVEFMFDESTGEYYFLEINTRLQVEHPVTEEITGLDLVQMQIESAQGMSLSVIQDDIRASGYALECRLYAEDPTNNFMPVSGTIHKFHVPDVEGLRLESTVKSGSEISIYYDPMIAKLIIWDRDRQSAIRKMQYVLRQMACMGIVTNQDFLLMLLNHPEFIKGQYDTDFINKTFKKDDFGKLSEEQMDLATIASILYMWSVREQSRTLLKNIPSGWRNNFYDYQKDSYLIGEDQIDMAYRYEDGSFHFKNKDNIARIYEVKNDLISVEINSIINTFHVIPVQDNIYLQSELTGHVILKKISRFPLKQIEKSQGGYKAPMPSEVIRVIVNEGDTVNVGDPLIVLSSMKMENIIAANSDGMVEEIYVSEGDNIDAGTILLKFSE